MSDPRGDSGSSAQHTIQAVSDSGNHGQYTIEGEIAQWGSFASGARRRGGRSLLFARAIVVVMLVGLLGAPLLTLFFGD